MFIIRPSYHAPALTLRIESNFLTSKSWTVSQQPSLITKHGVLYIWFYCRELWNTQTNAVLGKVELGCKTWRHLTGGVMCKNHFWLLETVLMSPDVIEKVPRDGIMLTIANTVNIDAIYSIVLDSYRNRRYWNKITVLCDGNQWPILLKWFNFNSSMDK